MSSDQFNNGSLPKYENHVQVFKATNKLSAQGLQDEQPSMEEAMEMMFDPSKAEAFMEKQKQKINDMVLQMETVKKGIQNSDALSEDVRDAFTTSLLAQQNLMAGQAKMMGAQAGGMGSEQDLIQAVMEMQEAQTLVAEKSRELQETVYNFQAGEEFNATTLSEDLTFDEFERAAALIQYTASSDDAIQNVAMSMQTGDMSAMDDYIDNIEHAKQCLQTLAYVANKSTHITADQKSAANGFVSASTDMFDVLVTTIEGLSQGDMSAMENLMKLPETAKAVTDAQTTYYDVLDQHYQDKSKPANNNTLGKKGPKNGSNNP